MVVVVVGTACLVLSCSAGPSAGGPTSLASRSSSTADGTSSSGPAPTAASMTVRSSSPGVASTRSPATTQAPTTTEASTATKAPTTTKASGTTRTPNTTRSPSTPRTPGTITSSPSPAPLTGTEIVTATSQFGDILFDAENQAIYLFGAEDSTTPGCYGECAVAWPPVLTDGDPRAGGAIDPKLLGTTRRSDGSTQVTYGGHPLYYYAHEGPGEVTCHNVDEYGGLWLVVQPDGAAVGT